MVTSSPSPAPQTSARPRAALQPREAVVVVQGLNKTFKDFWLRTRAKAVDNLTFHVDKGEVFGLLGPNGSGKSTSIKIILGLLKPTGGRVAVFGKPPTDVAIKKRIGYLPEESYLYPFLNARETLDYYGKLFQLDRSVRVKRIDELLDMVGLTSVQHRAVKEYSKGMQRRIGIAQALINDPELLILDEPTTGLDPIGTRQIKDLIIELGRRGKSIILSSHLLADVEDCVHRMTILYGGKKQQEGTCDELLETQDRSIIETENLDDETVRQIDELIRRRTNGASGIERISRPRQRLEDLFVDIVNRATAQRTETSGAMHGGQTAEFLRAAPEEGVDLLQSLTREEPAVPAAPAPAARPKTGPDDDVLARLSEQPAAPAPPAPAAPRPDQAAASLDRGLLDSLSGDDKQ
ncbi:MAG TPA: ABC transporter ATP-binding protein [Phycisphaerales bacterium]|nr:ABC transporter ATP-binding protein [Phycisphaerales bacterium]